MEASTEFLLNFHLVTTISCCAYTGRIQILATSSTTETRSEILPFFLFDVGSGISSSEHLFSNFDSFPEYVNIDVCCT